MLRQTREVSIGTSIVRKKDTQGIQPLQRRNGKVVAKSDLHTGLSFNKGTENTIQVSKFKRIGQFRKKKKKKKGGGGFRWSESVSAYSIINLH